MKNYSSEFYNFAVNLKSYLPDQYPEYKADCKVLKEKKLIALIDKIIEYNDRNKGVYTVLITLLFYKIHHPEQDIRYHQVEIGGKGFSGRSFDTAYITPNLKKLGLPSMAESGWLTRSLEQSSPYDLNFPGKISNVKQPFLRLIDAVETANFNPEIILRYLLYKSFEKNIGNKIKIIKLTNNEGIGIQSIINALEKQFNHPYKTAGAAKLPMLAFYAIYEILVKELVKYKNTTLAPLGSYTASDRTSNSSGDLEILDSKNQVVESIEIKLGHKITLHMLKRAEEKIYKFNPQRYYILSTEEIETGQIKEIQTLIKNIKDNHGCQIILNGVLHTLRYYLRLISDVNEFINKYSELIQDDTELKLIHKEYWKNTVEQLKSGEI